MIHDEDDDALVDGWQIMSDAALSIDRNPFAEVAALKAIYAHFHDADPRVSFEAYAVGRLVASLLRKRRVLAVEPGALPIQPFEDRCPACGAEVRRALNLIGKEYKRAQSAQAMRAAATGAAASNKDTRAGAGMAAGAAYQYSPVQPF